MLIKVNLATPDIKYIIDVMLSDFLGFEFDIVSDSSVDKEHLELHFNGKYIKVLNKMDSLKNCSFDSIFSVKYLDTKYSSEKDLPVLLGEGSISKSENGIDVGFDIFSVCFFFLTRMEELNSSELDHVDRFPLKKSILWKLGLTERPIVDEYTEFLWALISDLDGTATRKKLQFIKNITCDIDLPFDPIRRSLSLSIIKFGGDIIKRRSFGEALETAKKYIQNLIGNNENDLLRDNITWMMDVNDKHNNSVSFYIIPKPTSKFDFKFDYTKKELIFLLDEIALRGHFIGVHPGFNCYNNGKVFIDTAVEFKRLLADRKQVVWGGRMHCLRFDIGKTPQLWQDNNFIFDSTLGYAEKGGFRCGTCRPFHLYDFNKQVKMNLVEIPLIVMECSIIEERYEGLGYSQMALDRFKYFENIVKKYNGTYTLLWHNSSLPSSKSKWLYEEVIK